MPKTGTAGAFQFELTGGVVCFDFANTVDSRCAPSRRLDHLTDFHALASWARQSGVISTGEAHRLVLAAGKHPDTASKALRRAVELREVVYRIFSAVAGCARPSEEDLILLACYTREALSHMRLISAEGGFAWRLTHEQDDLLIPLWPVAKSAADLLVSGELGKVRECAADNCGWLFMDRSRNQSRRWCDMKICGNREKARQHHRRVREMKVSV